jgi:hypothetical protein
LFSNDIIGTAACVLEEGVLNRGEAEAGIQENALRPGALYLLLALYTLLALLFRGYCVGKEDQNLYLPFILHWNDPSLFPADHLLQHGFARQSFVWIGIAFAARWLPLTGILFALWFALAFLGLFLTFKTAEVFWRSARAGWLAVLLWIPSYVVPGVANTTFDDYLTTRLFGTTCGLLALYGLFSARHGLMALGLFLGALTHVISVLPLAAGLALACLWARNWRALGLAAASLGAGVLAILGYSASFGKGHDLFALYADRWLRIVQHADPELFPQLWTKDSWVGCIAYLASFAALVSLGRVWQKREARMAVLVAAGLLAAALAGTAGILANLALAVQLCLWRGQLFVLFMLVVLLAGLGGRLVDEAGDVLSALALGELVLWVAGEWPMKVAACALVLALTHRAAVTGAFHRVARSRRTQLVLLLGALAAVLLAQAYAYFANWTPADWLPRASVLLGAAVPAVLFFALRRWGSPLWRRSGLQWAPCLLAATLVVVPSPMMVDWLRHIGPVRKAYGVSIVTKMARAAKTERDLREKRAMGELVRSVVPKTSAILAPPGWKEFRLHTHRTPFITFKDGAPSEFDRAYADLWLERLLEIGGIEDVEGVWLNRVEAVPPPERCLELAGKYRDLNLDFVVTKKPMDLPLVGRAGAYSLYRMSGEPAEAVR